MGEIAPDYMKICNIIYLHLQDNNLTYQTRYTQIKGRN